MFVISMYFVPSYGWGVPGTVPWPWNFWAPRLSQSSLVVALELSSSFPSSAMASRIGEVGLPIVGTEKVADWSIENQQIPSPTSSIMYKSCQRLPRSRFAFPSMYIHRLESQPGSLHLFALMSTHATHVLGMGLWFFAPWKVAQTLNRKEMNRLYFCVISHHTSSFCSKNRFSPTILRWF